MWPSATPATHTAAAPTAPNGAQAHHQSQPSAISATPATRSDDLCREVPRLPRKVTGRCGQVPRLSRSATPAMQSDGRCRQVPRNHGAKRGPSAPSEPAQCHKCHDCHAKGRSMSPSATPASQTAAATTAPNGPQARHQSQPDAVSATPATRSDDLCREVPRLPRKVTVDVARCRACHGV